MRLTPLCFLCLTLNPVSASAKAPRPPTSASTPRIELREDRIQLKEKIRFEINKARIKPNSFPLLDEIAALLIKHPRLKRVLIEGHRDSHGRDFYGMRITQKRAESVRRYLIHKGVAPERLEAKGFGEDRPIDTNRTAEGRANNRRVELRILEHAPVIPIVP